MSSVNTEIQRFASSFGFMERESKTSTAKQKSNINSNSRPQTCCWVYNHLILLSEPERELKIMSFLFTLHLDLSEIIIIKNSLGLQDCLGFKSHRVKQDEFLGQAELTGCPFMSSVAKHWFVVTSPCQSQKAFDVNICYIELINFHSVCII